MFVIEDVIRGLETVLEPDRVQEVRDRLRRCVDRLDGGRFQDLRVSTDVFGGSAAARALGTHHDRAHEVVAATLERVVADIRHVHDGVVAAETLLGDADDGARADLARGVPSDAADKRGDT